MKAYIINPWNGSVQEEEIKGGLQDLYERIKCELIEVGWRHPTTGDVMYVDEEGLLGDNQMEMLEPEEFKFFGLVRAGFEIDGVRLVGRAVVVGTTRGGEDADVKCKIEDVMPSKFFAL